jgi:hypothetical protein
VIYWIELPGGVLLGISEFRNVPEQVLTVKEWFNGTNRLGASQILLFPSVSKGRPFGAALGAVNTGYGSIYMRRKEARSRYSILGSGSSPDRYLLLYTHLISGPKLSFFLDFFERMKLASRGSDRMLARGAQILSKVLQAYAIKQGFDFVSPSEELQRTSLRVSVGNWDTYISSKILQVLVNRENSHEAASFLVEKIDITFFMLDWKMVEWFYEVFNILGAYSRVLTIIRSVRDKSNLEPLLMQRFREHDAKTRARLKGHPDLVRALDYIFEKEPGVDSDTSYASYIQSRETILVEAVRLLDNSYVYVDSIEELMNSATEYLRQIDLELPGTTPRFGAINNFLRKCDEVFHKEGIYPEVRISAGMAEWRVLESLVFRRHDYAAYLNLVRISQEEADLFESALPIIKKKNHKSPLSYLDAAIGLLSASSIARTNEEPDVAERLWNEGCAFVERHDIAVLRTRIYWAKFLRTYDYDNLRAIQRLHLSADQKQNPGYLEKNQFIGQVAIALLQEKDQDMTLDRAEGYLGTDVSPDSMVGIVLDQFNLEASLYLSHLLRALFSCLGGIDEQKLDSLRRATMLMERETSPISDTQTLFLKTQILLGAIKGDVAVVEEGSSRIGKLTETDSGISSFVNAAKRWVQTPADRRGLRFYQLLDTELDHQDAWARILTNFMKENAKKELRPEDILDYDAMVLVEGAIDARVYPILFKIVGGKNKLLFIDAGGWTNMNYFALARNAVAFRRPLTVVFDGDTNSAKNTAVKQRLVTELKIPDERVLTLPGRTLENFLLVPRAIKEAFPEITLSQSEIIRAIQESGNKRNKKDVIQAILIEYAGIRYNEDSAARIASAIHREDIKPEMQSILSRFAPYPGHDATLTGAA